ncbi:unnamed protein product [Rotaria socialis]|uniref:Uncharacterized protein n=1 Tax=Rotaria socialis TaxID=392032 RepID=A0A817ZPC2_9BILA|nr:unnamed protein product [Rotaria socialis]
MERDDGDGGSDNIQTPNTSRSNSINEDETRFSPPIAPINELETQSPEIADEQIKHMPETQLSIISSSSSNSDTDFVAINKSDFDSEVVSVFFVYCCLTASADCFHAQTCNKWETICFPTTVSFV